MKDNEWLIVGFAVLLIVVLGLGGHPLSVSSLPPLSEVRADMDPSLTGRADSGGGLWAAGPLLLSPSVGKDYSLSKNTVTGNWILNDIELSSATISPQKLCVLTMPKVFDCSVTTVTAGTYSYTAGVQWNKYVTCQGWTRKLTDSTVDIAQEVDTPSTTSTYCTPVSSSYHVFEKDSRLVYAKDGCAIDGSKNESIASTQLKGGQSVSLTGIDSAQKFLRFCVALPPTITDDNTNQSYQDPQIYYDLVTKGSVIVPASKTYTIFYVTKFDNNPFYKCSDGFGYDQSQKACVPVSGQVFVCPTGQLVGNKCLVQPDVFCPSNTVYNGTMCVAPNVIDCALLYGQNSHYEVRSGVGVCVSTPPAVPDCSRYGMTAVFNSDRNMCIYTPASQADCSVVGGSYDVVSNTCVVTPPLRTDCSRYGPAASFDGTNCVVVPTRKVDCSAYPGTVLSGSSCIVTAASNGVCALFGGGFSFNGTHCLSTPTDVIPPRAFDCSSYGSTALYNGSACVITPSLAPSGSTGSLPWYAWVVIAGVIIVGVIVYSKKRG